MAFAIFLIVAAVLVLFLMSIFNKLVRLRNGVKNAFSQIDVQLKRRYDLIPNLVETAKGYLKHERETLEKVILARNQAMQIEQVVAQNPSNGENFQNLMQVEGQLKQALSRLMVVMESYPDLKSNTTMNQLMEELSSAENKISFARQAFNDAVMDYNNQREMFPHRIIAEQFHFQIAHGYEIENSQEKENVKVSFN